MLVQFCLEAGSPAGDWDGDDDAGRGEEFGGWGDPVHFEVASGVLCVGDPCYALTPDTDEHPATLGGVRAMMGGGICDSGPVTYLRAEPGRWSAMVALRPCGDRQLQGAVLFERA